MTRDSTRLRFEYNGFHCLMRREGGNWTEGTALHVVCAGLRPNSPLAVSSWSICYTIRKGLTHWIQFWNKRGTAETMVSLFSEQTGHDRRVGYINKSVLNVKFLKSDLKKKTKNRSKQQTNFHKNTRAKFFLDHDAKVRLYNNNIWST